MGPVDITSILYAKVAWGGRTECMCILFLHDRVGHSFRDWSLICSSIWRHSLGRGNTLMRSGYYIEEHSVCSWSYFMISLSSSVATTLDLWMFFRSNVSSFGIWCWVLSQKWWSSQIRSPWTWQQAPRFPRCSRTPKFCLISYRLSSKAGTLRVIWTYTLRVVARPHSWPRCARHWRFQEGLMDWIIVCKWSIHLCFMWGYMRFLCRRIRCRLRRVLQLIYFSSWPRTWILKVWLSLYLMSRTLLFPVCYRKSLAVPQQPNILLFQPNAPLVCRSETRDCARADHKGVAGETDCQSSPSTRVVDDVYWVD